ncbi:hypothetical protein CSHISOI_03261 [Colletotrichum shisoi]|uniref:Uncharacterized protein n=1 Tax=Colletotrichum shisoi TaxID=2078593 RepID=A0A5Q4BYQ3_9PEZI|nr:hypothetical protein CSHISOI_03261 [Colletotrichum shisoi]
MPPGRALSDEPIPEGTPSYNDSTQDKPVWPRPASSAQRDPQRHEGRPRNGSVTAACLPGPSSSPPFPFHVRETCRRKLRRRRRIRKKCPTAHGMNRRTPSPRPRRPFTFSVMIIRPTLRARATRGYDPLRGSHAIITIRESRSSQ